VTCCEMVLMLILLTSAPTRVSLSAVLVSYLLQMRYMIGSGGQP